MTRIPVEKPAATSAAGTSAEDENITEQIRQLAYHLFESRGGSNGRDLDDWLEAERELVLAPEPKVVERDGKFEISMPAPGYDPREIHVTVLPSSLSVRAGANGKTHKTLLAKVDLPKPIDADRTSARFDNGVLHVTAVSKTPERRSAAV